MKSSLRVILIFLSLLVLAGCSLSGVYTKVTPFYTDDLKSYKKYKIAPIESQKNSLAFKQYSKIIQEKLSKIDMLESNDQAELIMYIDYGISGSQKISGAVPVYGEISGGTIITTYGKYNDSNKSSSYRAISHAAPTYGVIGVAPYSITEFTRFLTVDIFNIRTKEKVYESRALSVGETDDINEAMPYLINAVFDNFPGKNGETMEIKQKTR